MPSLFFMIAKIKYYLQKLIENQLSMFLILLYISEGVYKLLVYNSLHEIKISAAIKIALQLFFLVVLIKKAPRKLILVVALVLLFLLGQLVLLPDGNLLENIIFLDKYLFIILLLLYVNTLEIQTKNVRHLMVTFESIIVINSILIFLGYLFSIGVLESYRAPRFGYDGLILRSGAASYIYWFALFYLTHQIFVLKKRKYITAIIVLLAALMLGTKTIILALALLPLYLFFEFRLYKKKGVLIPVIVICVGSYFWLPWAFDFFSSYSGTLNEVTEREGFITSFFSYRNVHLIDEMIPSIQERWSVVNYLFGGGYDMHMRSQFGILDLFYFFGILGSALYLYIFGKPFITFKLNLTTVFFMIGTFILMSLAANFFYETIIAIYLVGIKCYFDKIRSF
jgi:hypothetical protein